MARTPTRTPAYDLLPTSIAARMPNLGETYDQEDPLLHLKWFTPDASFTWFLAEYDPKRRIGYGYVIGPFREWGTFSLDEIRQIRGHLNLPVERDLYFESCPASEVVSQH